MPCCQRYEVQDARAMRYARRYAQDDDDGACAVLRERRVRRGLICSATLRLSAQRRATMSAQCCAVRVLPSRALRYARAQRASAAARQRVAAPRDDMRVMRGAKYVASAALVDILLRVDRVCC